MRKTPLRFPLAALPFLRICFVMGSSRLFWKLAATHGLLGLALTPVLWAMACPQNDLVALTSLGGLARLLLMAGIGVLAGGVSWLIVVRSWSGAEKLLEALQAMGREEEPPPPLAVDRRSEAAPLVIAFQRMLRRLAQRDRRFDEQNERLTTVLDGMEEGVLALDAQRCVLLANGASRRLLEMGPGKIVGRPLLDVARSREIHAAVEEALRRDGVYESEFETSAEPRRHLRVRAKRLAGEPSPGVVLVLDDVSKLRRLENLRTEFAANVSHELKTPLASIKAYAETLRLGAVHDPEHNLTFVARIEEHADRLHFLISDLMQLARVESGKEAFEIVDFPLGELVEECVDYHRESADAKQIAISVDAPQTDPEVRSDEVGVRTILDNLLNNAIKYTPEGGHVEVAWRSEGRFVLLEVRDTGIGIAPEDQERVFERFYRVDKARARNLGGTGLGLSIVKHTAQALGGRVGLESRLGQGSTFRVWLPEANGRDAN